MDKTAKLAGTCAACGRMDLPLSKTGKIWTHKANVRNTGGVTLYTTCRGAGRPPKEQQ